MEWFLYDNGLHLERVKAGGILFNSNDQKISGNFHGNMPVGIYLLKASHENTRRTCDIW